MAVLFTVSCSSEQLFCEKKTLLNTKPRICRSVTFVLRFQCAILTKPKPSSLAKVQKFQSTALFTIHKIKFSLDSDTAEEINMFFLVLKISN